MFQMLTIQTIRNTLGVKNDTPYTSPLLLDPKLKKLQSENNNLEEGQLTKIKGKIGSSILVELATPMRASIMELLLKETELRASFSLHHSRVISKGGEKKSVNLLPHDIHKPIRGKPKVRIEKRDSFPPSKSRFKSTITTPSKENTT